MARIEVQELNLLEEESKNSGNRSTKPSSLAVCVLALSSSGSCVKWVRIKKKILPVMCSWTPGVKIGLTFIRGFAKSCRETSFSF